MKLLHHIFFCKLGQLQNSLIDLLAAWQTVEKEEAS